MKSEHGGPKHAKGYWGTKEEAKTLSKIERRKVEKEIIAQAKIEVEAPAQCFWCGITSPLNSKGECRDCSGENPS